MGLVICVLKLAVGRRKLSMIGYAVCVVVKRLKTRYTCYWTVGYNHLRSEMLDTIRNRTGDFYQLSLNRNNKQWMLQTLLGENILDKDHRKLVQAVVASFLRKAMKRRKLLTDGTD